MSASVTHSEDGSIYFGSINGVCCFNPGMMLGEQDIPPVVITEMKALERLDNQESGYFSKENITFRRLPTK